ncbi:DUF1799 domain-containing protein [Telluria beijingensis]|uniref:DUF1799 domain-containing protein n=1 Tax=Telluria beijingensis TaxID=3068633 RepID=UPI002795A971|nr:DUF1799 domain-containing protein [Massilia sp. REN29]
MAGLRREDLAAETVEIWPENFQAYQMFCGMQRQWVLAPMGGPIALNFLVAYNRMDRMGLTPEEYNQLDEDLQIMEGAALEAMRSKG